MGHIASDGGSIKLNGQAAAAQVHFVGRVGDRGVSQRIEPRKPWREATAEARATLYPQIRLNKWVTAVY